MKSLLTELYEIKKLMGILNEEKLILIHNKEKAPYLGDRFGQTVEPAGYYAVEYSGFVPENWEMMELEYSKPLIIPVTSDTLVSWKYELSDTMKAKKHKLSQKLMSLGYDVIITKYSNNDTGEIIVLDTSKLKPINKT